MKEEQNAGLVKTARNQLLIIIIVFATSGLWMNYQFLTTINARIDLLQTMIDFRFGTLEKSIDKMDNRLNKIPIAKTVFTPEEDGTWKK